MIVRLIPFRYFKASMNMALDEAIMEGIRGGTSPATIRFYGWQPSAVSIGYFQGIHYEVNLEACKKAGVDVVRRITGGGAVYHDRDGEITYSILGATSQFPEMIIDSYKLICGSILTALETLGIQATFQPINDIVVNEKKISGNAQTRRGGVLLQHGTVLYQVDVEKMFTYLTVSEEKISDKLISSVKKRVTSISELAQIPFEDVIKAFEEAFSEKREVERGDYSPVELERAAQLASEKYSTSEWLFKR
jgi:lipoyltransferase/lipoate-protein ligase